MDQESPMADTAEAVDHWGGSTAEELVREFARTQNAIAGHHSAGVTFPGETADMNAPLVNAVRHAKTLEFVLDLHGLADQVHRQEERQACIRAREAKRASQQAYSQGVADGVEKGKDYHAREVADAEARSLHGNPAVVREQERVVIPAGYVAAWFHVLEEPDGTMYHRQVFGRLAVEVREGDTRAVITAGPDRLLVGLDRIRFAPTLAAIVAEQDLKALSYLEVVTGDQSTVRLRDSMDGQSRMDVSVQTVTPDEAPEDGAPGTYIRLVTEGSERTVIDLSKDKWQQLIQAVETLYARRVIADSEGGEE